MEFIIFFLVLIAPGFIAQIVFSTLSRYSGQAIVIGLVFDLLIFIINDIGLRYIKGILLLTDLQVYFNCMSFLWKYAVLSIGVGIVLAFIFWPIGILLRLRTRNSN